MAKRDKSRVTRISFNLDGPSGSFDLFAKATLGDKTITYGPVSSMVIEGWVRKPLPSQEPPRQSKRI
jgi:hypothetical protein